MDKSVNLFGFYEFSQANFIITGKSLTKIVGC